MYEPSQSRCFLFVMTSVASLLKTHSRLSLRSWSGVIATPTSSLSHLRYTQRVWRYVRLVFAEE